jgi:Flp pilus assembly protein TadD
MSGSFDRTPHFRSVGPEAEMRRFLSEHPDDPTARATLGLLLAVRSRHQEALAEARHALRLDPDTALAHYVLSRSLGYGLGRAKAIAAAERAIQLDPCQMAPCAQLAYLHLTHPKAAFRAGHARAALRAADAALGIDPLNVWCLGMRASALRRLGRHEEAEDAHTTALALAPDTAYLYANYGMFLMGRGEMGRALTALQETSRLEPGIRLHRHRIGLIRGIIRIRLALRRAAERLHLLRFTEDDSSVNAPRMPSVNWTTGLLVWMAVMASTRMLLDSVGDLSPLGICLPAGLLVLLGAFAFNHCAGLKRLVIGGVSGFLSLLWLELSALMFISPRHLSTAVNAAWPHLHLGASFYFARITGLFSVVGMLLFLIAAFGLRWITRSSETASVSRHVPPIG